MGMRVRVKTKSNDEVYLTKLNAGLKEQGLKFFSFNTEKSNENWLKEINSKNSEQKHLIPGGQLKLRMSQLKKIFPAWTEIGVLDFDVAFGRTSEEDIKKVCEFIVEHKNDIAELDYADDLIERGSLTKEVAKAIKELEKPEEEPEKLPKSEQSLHKDIQSGLLLCKSFSPSPFWVIFGNVERPKFMKEKIYKEDIYNNIYKDKKGLAYLLIPLLRIGLPAEEVYDTIFNPAWNMGLRELPQYFLPIVYHLGFNYADGITKKNEDTAITFDKVAKEFSEFYLLDELIERFANVYKSIDCLSLNHPQVFFESSQFKFNSNNSDNSSVTNLADLLTVLIRAIKILDEKKAVSMVLAL